MERTAGLDDEDGRGLQLVEYFAGSWGYRLPETGGKVVWCSIPIRA